MDRAETYSGAETESASEAETKSVSESARRTDFYALVADVWGDGREEVVLFSYALPAFTPRPMPLRGATLTNETLYPGM